MRSASRRPVTTRTRENELREVPLWRACDSGSSGVGTATRRTLSYACAVKGNAAAARYTYECRTRGPQVDFLGATDAHAHRREVSPAGNHCSYCAAAGAPHCFVKINA